MYLCNKTGDVIPDYPQNDGMICLSYDNLDSFMEAQKISLRERLCLMKIKYGNNRTGE